MTCFCMIDDLVYASSSARAITNASISSLLMTSGGVTIFIPLFSNMLTAVPAWCVMLAGSLVFAAGGVIFKLQYTDALKN